MTQWSEQENDQVLDDYLESDEGRRWLELFSGQLGGEEVFAAFRRDAARRTTSADSEVTDWWNALTSSIKEDYPHYLTLAEALAQRGKDLEDVYYALPEEFSAGAFRQALESEVSAQPSDFVISNTTEWTQEQIRTRLNEVTTQLGLELASAEAQQWWHELELESLSLAPMLRLAEQLAHRKISCQDFYLSRQQAQTENLVAVMDYHHYLRLRDQPAPDKLWYRARSGITRIKGWDTEQVQTLLALLKEELGEDQAAPNIRQWWKQLEQQHPMENVVRLAEELKLRRVSLARFHAIWLEGRTQNLQAALYYFEYFRRVNPEPSFAFPTLLLDRRGKEIERKQLQARQFIEELAPDIQLEMVEIPGGTFTMGSPPSEENSFEDERPQHQVTVAPFYLGKFAVTQEQWRVIAADTSLKVKIDLDPEPARFKNKPDSARRPVEQVSWEEAQEFCARLAKKTGRAYRLPSEAEWEYACRAGTTTPFAFGETITPEIVNYNGEYPYAEAPKGKYRKETIPVGSVGVANSWGLFDMHGNVWEWCEDVWLDNYNSAPEDGSAWTSGGNSNRRILRGGSWNLNGYYCRSALRYDNAPDARYDLIGFRVVVAARTM